ncbi:ubiquitin carboxyl-terminal hydrolase 30 homolog [Anopheles ziemanni]|uniref:ubiquitin carboxyl-terminal hydrolase 30 homolog n=1 Tax=Anopheles coustani TaxID=139045 RepID=UPI00265A0169|nr:ubiquitin carboxyl-terminal hydrolase 30 homolog [Anopheles coustani]XP_058175526.1 ubiquitin carboxyl-terminal hydrolase 30 homolog [Anopheles ziemanni]
MESEKLLMAAGVTAAVVVGAFVFWGPSGSSKLRQRRGQIAGLHNFGKTCFLNTLLQALAACPQFIAWLQLHNTKDKKSLVSSLQNVLEVVNGTHPTLRGDPYAPGAVIRALHALGWVISPEEHDAHELLLVMLSSLEEEVSKPRKIGCLSDALDDIGGAVRGPAGDGIGGGDISSGFHPIPARPSSAMLSDFCNAEYDESTILTRYTRSEAHTPDSPHSVCTENEEQSQDGSLLEFGASPAHTISAAFSGGVSRRFIDGSRVAMPPPLRQADAEARAEPGGFAGKRHSASYRSLERLNRGPGRVSVWGDKQHQQIPHPFRGGMGSQLQCGGCGYKSTVRYDKFDSITLPLPETAAPGLGIGNLLSDFIQPEMLDAVQCESCHETTTHTKTITFSKLPACLCIHIARTTWLASGRAHKRLDSIHFPETLSMAPYSFVQPGLNSNISTPWGSTTSLYTAGLVNLGQTEGGDCASNEGASGSSMTFGSYTFGAMFPRNLYRLLAVIVHSGEANAGHFVTYRRGALRNSYKWYYTSDTVVREVPIEEVLNSSAYMLFYDRGSSSKYP